MHSESGLPTIAFHKLAGLANGFALKLAGITDVRPLDRARQRLEEWQGRGYAGEMQYMRREPALLAEPARLLPDARSIVSFAIRYDRAPLPERLPGQGRVARYAWGRDYHRVLKKRLAALARAVEQELGRPIAHRIFSDAVPLLERAVAEKAGLGFVGKNTLHIRPGSGSYHFLAEILWNVEVREPPFQQVDTDCGSCSRCLSACPTGALVSERQLDARLCISYLTIEKRGSLEHWEREALGEWIFGCDLCQEICPFNHSSLKRQDEPDIADFAPGRGAGPLLGIADLLSIRGDEAFAARFAGTPLMRPGRAGLLRNAAAVAVNTRAEALADNLAECARLDPDPIVRQHALWALWRLSEECDTGRADLDKLLDGARVDPSERVRSEAEYILERWRNGSFPA